MGRLLGLTHRTTDRPDGPRVLDLDSPQGEEAIAALSSETARTLLSELYDGPATPPELREAVGTSLQNVHYHLEQLQEAGLVNEAGVSYSEKGTEMTVFEPAGEALLVVAGKRSVRDRIRTVLSRVLGSVAVLAVATVAFAVGIDLFGPDTDDHWSGQSLESSEVAQMTNDAATTAKMTADTVAHPAIDPVVAFALGGLVVVLAVGVVWAIRSSDVEIRT